MQKDFKFVEGFCQTLDSIWWDSPLLLSGVCGFLYIHIIHIVSDKKRVDTYNVIAYIEVFVYQQVTIVRDEKYILIDYAYTKITYTRSFT